MRSTKCNRSRAHGVTVRSFANAVDVSNVEWRIDGSDAKRVSIVFSNRVANRMEAAVDFNRVVHPDVTGQVRIESVRYLARLKGTRGSKSSGLRARVYAGVRASRSQDGRRLAVQRARGVFEHALN